MYRLTRIENNLRLLTSEPGISTEHARFMTIDFVIHPATKGDDYHNVFYRQLQFVVEKHPHEIYAVVSANGLVSSVRTSITSNMVSIVSDSKIQSICERLTCMRVRHLVVMGSEIGLTVVIEHVRRMGINGFTTYVFNDGLEATASLTSEYPMIIKADAHTKFLSTSFITDRDACFVARVNPVLHNALTRSQPVVALHAPSIACSHSTAWSIRELVGDQIAPNIRCWRSDNVTISDASKT